MLARTCSAARLGVVGIVAALMLSACGGGESEMPTKQAASTTRAAALPRAIVVDTDLGADDVIALALLLRTPGVDVRAVTVSGTGLVHCPVGARHVLSMLAELGAGDLPVGCGRRNAGPDGLAFPEPWRAASDQLYGLELPTAGGDGGADAVEVLNSAITSSVADVTIVALGPWTNLQDLLARHPEAFGRIVGIHAMAGAIDVAGNVGEAGEPVAEWNVRADPSAFAAVLRAGSPVTLVPLDATNAVPLTPGFLDGLGDDRSAAGADLAWRLLSSNPFLLSGGQYLWDELAAIAFVDPTLVQTEPMRVRVDTTGRHAGRIVRTDAGPEIQVALDADGARAVDAILEALRTGG